MTDALNSKMKLAGFGEVTEDDPCRLFLCTQGPDKSGKTDFALRYAPGPVGVISFDTGTRKMVRKHNRHKQIYLTNIRRPKEQRGNVSATQRDAGKDWNRFMAAHSAILGNPDIRTYVVDTATEMHELLRLARFGKLTQVMPHHYGPVNADMRDLWKEAYEERPDLHMIVIHKEKKEYRESKVAGKGDVWTGKFERAGFDDFRHLADMLLRHEFDASEDEFTIEVVKERGSSGCRFNPELAGKVWRGHQCTFTHIAMDVFPEADLGQWDDGRPDNPLGPEGVL